MDEAITVETAENEDIEQIFWYAVQTLHCRETNLSDYLKEKGLECFIPMQYEKVADKEGREKRVLVPAVHNLLFLKKTVKERALRSLLADCPYPIILYKNKETRKLYEIPDIDMVEFRAVCDPSYEGTLYLDAQTAEERIGSKVRVVHGQFKGLEGKLVRYKGRHYVTIVVANLGVFVHIPKWYTEPIAED